MSGRGTQIYTHRGGHIKYENEPEEGEIIDDYDLIVSSDEELSMRQRILELEAENDEIEQIAVISRSYVDKINHSHNNLETNRAAEVPTDVSSISSTEFVTPQKRKRKKSKERKRKHCHHQYPREYSRQYEESFRHGLQKLPPRTPSKKAHCKRRQKLFAKKHKKFQSNHFIHQDIKAETLALESLESSDSSSIIDIGNYSSNCFKPRKEEYAFNKGKYITRDTLRMAVARNTNDSKPLYNKCLKDKLLKQELVGQCSKDKEYGCVEEPVIRVDNDEDDDVQVIENEPLIQTIDEDSADSLEEKELRLIALKSAVLKKHMARKKRNAAVAYSPTDFDEMLNSRILRSDNKIDDIDIYDLEGEDSQPACVTVSPEASPQLIMLDDQEESQQTVDCKPVDMDIANSDSEDAIIESWSKDVDSCIQKYSTDSFDFAKSIQYGFIMQNLHEIPPPPPGVDDSEDVLPPSPCHVVYDTEMQDMELDNDNLTESQQKLGTKEISNLEHKQKNAEAEFSLQTKDCHMKEKAVGDDDEDEEEEALRALLLSKFQSPKNQKKSNNIKEVSDFKDKLPLKTNEFSTHSFNHSKTKPTEIILKEAVKRLKIHSQTETFKEEKTNDSCVEQNITLNDKLQEFSDKSNEYIFEKLRDRLNLYKNQSHLKSDPSQGNSEKYLPATNEIATNSCTEDKDGQALSHSGEVTSVIDISDITRRLQRIKENVLNSIPKVIENQHYSNQNFGNIRDLNESSIENTCQLNKPITNNISLTGPTSKDLSTSVTINKTVEANFDVHSNQTTFKVTIQNNAALKFEKDDMTGSHVDVSHKENDDTKGLENLPLENSGASCKTHLSSEKVVKASGKEKPTNEVDKMLVNKFVPATKVTPQTKYSLIRATKIVKPNKVINNNFNINQKQISQPTESSLVSKSLKSETNNKLATVSDSPRLITSTDQIKQMCKVAPFIISLQNSSNESSEEDVVGNYNSLYKPLCDYNDNASPLSLNLDSPSITPLRSNSPIDSSAEAVSANSNLEAFNSKAKDTPKPNKNIVKTLESDKTNKTPLAVRHLPAAAQTEYRKLVHRMKLLENKRKLIGAEDNKKENISNEKNSISNPPAENANKEGIKSDTADYVQKNSLVKKVLIKNASNSATSSAVAIANDAQQTVPNKTSKLHKGNVLRSYENLYIKFGAGIVNNLDKSLKLVEEAKKAKIAKMKVENRLKELKAEMDILQSKQKEEQQKISRIYPSICTTNEYIASLKQKRSKIYKAALSLGKTVKGDVYRLNNDLKEVITTKTKKLAAEIKTVNSLKVLDNKNKGQEIEENEKKDNEDCITKPEENNSENEVCHSAITSTEIVCSKTCKENGEESKANLLQTDICGNTEFQNLGTNDSKICENTEDISRPDENTEFNKTSQEMDSEETKPLPSYISPLEHLRNIDSNVDPNGVVCPYDLMGNCEDVTCKYFHITPKAKT